MDTPAFNSIVSLIRQSQLAATRAVNSVLVNLYWQVGAYISAQVAQATWGDKTIVSLAAFIAHHHPDLRGFDRRGLYRMKQFYETYCHSQVVLAAGTPQAPEKEQDIIVSPLVTQFSLSDIRHTLLAKISWSHHLILLSRTKSEEERLFYLNMCVKEQYSRRELERQISSSLYERVMIGHAKIPAHIKETYPHIANHFRDSYVFEFLNLPEPHRESELKKGLIKQMKSFILELGRDFLFVGEEYKVQVGLRDFYIDLVFYHRELQCLIAIELKTDRFEPEYIGKLNLYLEALDRDVKKAHENPGIGILLCKDKDVELVEYTMSRNLSPTLIAEYNTLLPDKKLLQQKLHELFENNNETS